MNRIVLALLATGTLTFAGCTVPPDLQVLEANDLPYRFLDYTWYPDIVTNGTGARVEMPAAFSDAAAKPRYVEQLMPLVGAEPNIGITSKGTVIVSTFDQTQRSLDKGKTWEVVLDFTTPNYPSTADYWSTADPMLWVDTETDRTFVQQMMSTTCTYIAYSDKEAAKGTWNERPYTCGLPLLDHMKITTANYRPFSPGTPEPAVKPYENVLYMCYNKFPSVPIVFDPNMGTWCAVSFDAGMTFAYDRQIMTPVDGCPGINGHPAAFPDGTVVVPIGTNFNPKRCKRPVTVVLSEDNGLSWTARSFAKTKRQVEIDPDITITPDGTAYLVYRDQDQILSLARSKDKFKTWEGPWRVSPAEHTLNAFSVITSGDDGRLSIAYLGTRTPQAKEAEPSNATGGTQWHLFVSTVLDAETDEPTFYTHQVTPLEDPVQVGCIWFYGGGGGPMGCRNLLDFIDMAHDADGRAYVAFTDGCSPRNGCTTDTDAVSYQSRDREVAVAVQDSGISLFVEKGNLPALGFVPPERYHP